MLGEPGGLVVGAPAFPPLASRAKVSQSLRDLGAPSPLGPSPGLRVKQPPDSELLAESLSPLPWAALYRSGLSSPNCFRGLTQVVLPHGPWASCHGLRFLRAEGCKFAGTEPQNALLSNHPIYADAGCSLVSSADSLGQGRSAAGPAARLLGTLPSGGEVAGSCLFARPL